MSERPGTGYIELELVDGNEKDGEVADHWGGLNLVELASARRHACAGLPSTEALDRHPSACDEKVCRPVSLKWICTIS
jgi:hypothetical protein